MRGGWFSPDGHWWWNGREWRPAAEAMRPRGVTFWILACAVGLLVFLGVGTCGLMFGTTTRGGPTSSVSRVTGASSGAQACSPRPCADAGGFAVLVDRVEWNYVPSAFFTAEPGNQFARVTVRFENHASYERHADPFQFVLKDQQGREARDHLGRRQLVGRQSDPQRNIRTALTRLPGDEGDHGRRAGLDA